MTDGFEIIAPPFPLSRLLGTSGTIFATAQDAEWGSQAGSGLAESGSNLRRDDLVIFEGQRDNHSVRRSAAAGDQPAFRSLPTILRFAIGLLDEFPQLRCRLLQLVDPFFQHVSDTQHTK